MSAVQLLAKYEQLRALMGQMREAANRHDWDRLIELEQQCSQLLGVIKTQDSAMGGFNDAERMTKLQLIEAMLDDDAEIRTLVNERLSALREMMKSNVRERRVLKAYGS